MDAEDPRRGLTVQMLQDVVDRLTERRYWQVPADLWPAWVALQGQQRVQLLEGTNLFLPTSPHPADPSAPCGAAVSRPGPEDDAREHYEWFLGRLRCLARCLAKVLPDRCETAQCWSSKARRGFKAGSLLHALADAAEQDCRDPRVTASLRRAVTSLREDLTEAGPLPLVHLKYGLLGPRFVLGQLRQARIDNDGGSA